MGRGCFRSSDGGKASTTDFRGSARIFKDDLVGLPLVGVGLGEADVGQDAIDELPCHLGGVLGMVVEGGNDGEDGGSGV